MKGVRTNLGSLLTVSEGSISCIVRVLWTFLREYTWGVDMPSCHSMAPKTSSLPMR